MLNLNPHVFATALDLDLVLMDVAADRYLAMPGAMRAPPSPAYDVEPDALAALETAGLRDPSSGGEIGRFLPPASLETGMAPPLQPLGPGDLLDLALALLATARRIRSGRVCSGYLRERQPELYGPVDPRVRQALGKLRTLRLLVPLPRRCLPASLLTSLFLKRKGFVCEVVFGVRSHPFEAHCWAEHRSHVLEDDLDRVRVFKPLAVGKL